MHRYIMVKFIRSFFLKVQFKELLFKAANPYLCTALGTYSYLIITSYLKPYLLYKKAKAYFQNNCNLFGDNEIIFDKIYTK